MALTPKEQAEYNSLKKAQFQIEDKINRGVKVRQSTLEKHEQITKRILVLNEKLEGLTDSQKDIMKQVDGILSNIEKKDRKIRLGKSKIKDIERNTLKVAKEVFTKQKDFIKNTINEQKKLYSIRGKSFHCFACYLLHSCF